MIKIKQNHIQQNSGLIQGNLLFNINEIVILYSDNKHQKSQGIVEELQNQTKELDLFVQNHEKEYNIYLSSIDIRIDTQKDVNDPRIQLQNEFIDQLELLDQSQENLQIDDYQMVSDSEEEEQNEIRQRRRSLVQMIDLFQQIQNSLDIQYQRLNSSISMKIENLPKNKQKLMIAKFLYSSFEILKELIINILMLTITLNINWISFVTILILFGIRHIYKMKFINIMYIISFTFFVKILSLPNQNQQSFLLDNLPYAVNKFLKLQEIKVEAFRVEIFAIGSCSFLLIPTMLLIKTVFEDFTKSVRGKNKNQQFYHHQEKGKQILEIDYQLWTSSGKHILFKIQNFLIMREKYIIPTILFILSLYKERVFKYFEIYMFYHFCYLNLVKKKIIQHSYLTLTIKNARYILQILNLIYLIYATLRTLFALNSQLYISQNAILIFFLLNIKLIIKNSEFLKFDKKRVKRLHNLQKELRIYLIDLSNNENFFLKKIIGQIKYDKIMEFQDRTMDQFFSLDNLTTSNVFFFVKTFINDFKLKIILNFYYYFYFLLFQKSQKLLFQNTFYLLLLLKSKYQNFIKIDLETIDLLTMKYDSGFESINKINNFRKKIRLKNKSIVKSGIQQIKKVKQEIKHLESLQQDLIIQNQNEIKTIDEFREVINKKLVDLNIQRQVCEESLAPKNHVYSISNDYELCIKNYKYNFAINKDGQPKISIYSFLNVFMLYIADKVDKILALLFIFCSLINYGTILTIFIGFFLFRILNDKGKQFQFKKSIYLFFFMILISTIKHFFRLVSHDFVSQVKISKETSQSIIFFLGNFNYWQTDLISLFIVFLLSTTYASKWTKSYFRKKEFFGEACYRIVLNEEVLRIGNKYHYDEISLTNCLLNYTNEQTLMQKKNIIIDKLNFYIQENIEIQKEVLRNLSKVFFSLKTFNNKNIYKWEQNNFYWRNFSFYNVNYKKDQLGIKIFLNFIFIVYNFYYFKIYKKQKILSNLSDISKDDTVEGILLFNLTLSIICILFEIIFYNYQTMKWSQYIKIQRNFSMEIVDVQPKIIQSPLQKLKSIINKYIYSKKLIKQVYQQKSYNQKYKNNTYIKKYKFNICIFVVFCYLFLIHMPSYDEELLQFTYHHLIHADIDIHLRLMLFVIILYITIAVWDNNADRRDDYDSILNNDWDSRVGNVVFKVYMNIPFITEIKTILTYISSKTSLDIFKWYRVEDIKRVLINANYIKSGIKRKKIGIEEPFYIKGLLSYGFFIVFFILLIAPLFFFSNLNFLMKSPEIQQINFSVYFEIQDESKQNFRIMLSKINYFEVTNIKNNDNSQQNSQLEQQLGEKINEYRNGIVKLSSSILSSEIYDYNLKFFQNKEAYDVRLKYQISLKTDQKDYIYEDQLNDFTVDHQEIFTILQMNCQDIFENKISNIYQKFYLGQMNITFQTTKTGDIKKMDSLKGLEKVYLIPECARGKKYYSLKQRNKKQLTFYLALTELSGEYYLKNLKQSSNTVIQQVLILVFLGITIIRKSLLNRVSIIWSEHIPETRNILKMIDYMELNRRDFKFNMYFKKRRKILLQVDKYFQKYQRILQINRKNGRFEQTIL